MTWVVDADVIDELRTTARSFLKSRLPVERVAGDADAVSAPVDLSVWKEMVDLGWTGLTFSEETGGAGAGPALLWALFEELGRSLAPVPFFTNLALVAPALERLENEGSSLVDGSRIYTLAWAEEDGADLFIDPTRISTLAQNVDDGWRISGHKRRVPDFAWATHAVVLARSDDGPALFLMDLQGSGIRSEADDVLDGTRRTYTLTFEDAHAVELDLPDVVGVLREIRRRSCLALAYEAVGLAERTLEEAVAYACARHQFAKPIGSFQAISGPLVDSYVDIQLARALSDWAALAVDQDDGSIDSAVAAAHAAAAEAAVAVAERAIQVYGAIGFTWEHQVHRSLRRALWISGFAGGIRGQRTMLSTALITPSDRPRTVELMDDDSVAAFRASVRAWIDEHHPLPEGGTTISSLERFEEAKLMWQREMRSTGHLVAHWPAEYGGRDASPVVTAVFREEAIRAHPRVSHGDCGVDLVAPLLIEYGTDAQKERFLPAIRSESEIWTQAFSEPNAGSDLAALETKAVRQEDYWVINGNKTWCTYAPVADWIFVLARTDPEAKRHRGISCFLVDARSPGVEIRPIRDIAGTVEFGEIFFTDVRVPAENLLGGVNEGWAVAIMTLAHERVIESYEDIGELDFVFDRLLDELTAWGSEGRSIDVSVREEIADAWCRLQGARVIQYRAATALAGAAAPPSESEIVKLVWSEVAQRVASLGVELFAGSSDRERTGESNGAFWRWNYMNSRSLTIYAGTTEIIKSIVAERVLGLPRSR